ncbi:histone-like nucleoid-structuring protein Lsr2 [Microbacterium sp. GXF7504]
MAKKVTVQLVDDLDGTPIPEGEGGTVVFSIDRKSYEIDLSDANQDKLRDALAPYIDAGRVVSAAAAAPRARAASKPASNGHDLTAVREWARKNGHTVSDRGRIPASILEAYDAAN